MMLGSPDTASGDIELCLHPRSSLSEPARDASSQGGRTPHISSGGPTPMMPVLLRRRIGEGGCPIKISVRRPYRRPSSPPHGTATQHGEVVTVVFPDVIDDLDQAPGQRHAGDLGPFAVLQDAEPRPQRTRLPGCLGRGEHQHPAQEAVAFLTDMPAADPVVARAHARGEPDVAFRSIGSMSTAGSRSGSATRGAGKRSGNASPKLAARGRRFPRPWVSPRREACERSARPTPDGGARLRWVLDALIRSRAARAFAPGSTPGIGHVAVGSIARATTCN